MKCGVSNTAPHITFLSYYIPFTGKPEPNKLTCSQLCDFVAQLVGALHRHRRGHGFESRESPEFFRFMRQLFKLSSKCEDHIFITNYMVEKRSDKCKKHENIKKRGIKNNKNIQE